MTQRPHPLEIAMLLLAAGISVIPLKARDKRPDLTSWKEFQTRRATEDEVRAWFENRPDRNVGLVTGAISDLVAIDADNQEMVERVHRLYPSPMRTRTKDGAHFFYRHPGHPVNNRAKVVGLELDIRGDGGYVVAPGSIHPTGAMYEAEGEWTDMADLPVFDPSWLGESKPSNKQQAARPSTFERVRKYLENTPGAIEGQGGDAHTYRVACKLVRGWDLSDSEALDHLSWWNSKCSPAWSQADLAAKIRSARAHGTGAFGALLGASRASSTTQSRGVSIEDGGQGSLIEVLRKNPQGKTLKTPGNLAKILRLDPDWGPRLSLNEMSREVCLDSKPQPDHWVDTVQEQIEERFGVAWGREEVAAKLLAQASQHAIHPVREWLQALPEWDGVERIRRMPVEILNTEGQAIYWHYMRCTLVGAVRRVFNPGSKLDTIPVLVGPQGYFKSTFWRILAGSQWFSDSPIDLDSKDGMLTLHRSLCTELGEIDHMTSTRTAERIKAFTSSCADTFRPPFARSVAVFPRSCFLVGSTNKERFLNDPTGSRRFWPIKIMSPIDIALLEKQREQIWAEAMNLYSLGAEHWLTSDHENLRVEDADRFECEDPWEAQLDQALDSLRAAGRYFSDGVSIADLLNQMGIPVSQQNRGVSMKLAMILKAKGWQRRLASSRRLASWFPEGA